MSDKLREGDESSKPTSSKHSRDFLKEQARSKFNSTIEEVEATQHTDKMPTSVLENQNQFSTTIDQVKAIQRTDEMPTSVLWRRHTSTPDRVNSHLDQLKATVGGDSKNKLIDHFSYLPAALAGDFIDAFQAGVRQFQTESNGALEHYGEQESGRYRRQRHIHETNLKNLKAMFTNMTEDLRTWHQYCLAESEAKGLGVVSQELEESAQQTEKNYVAVLQGYKNQEVEPAGRQDVLKHFNNYINTFKVYKEDRKLRPAWNNKEGQNLVKEVNKYTPGTPEWKGKVADLWVEYDKKVKAIDDIGDETSALLAQKFKERFNNIENIYKGVINSETLSYSQKKELRRWGTFKAPKELSLETLCTFNTGESSKHSRDFSKAQARNQSHTVIEEVEAIPPTDEMPPSVLKSQSHTTIDQVEAIQHTDEMPPSVLENQNQFSTTIDQVKAIQRTDEMPTSVLWRRHTSTPDRVNSHLDQLKATVGRDSKDELIKHFSYLPAALAGNFIDAFQAGVRQFQTEFNEALEHYGEQESGRYRRQRHIHETNLKNLKAMLTNMIGDLRTWHQYRLAESEAKGLGVVPQGLEESAQQTEKNYVAVLQGYKNQEVEPTGRQDVLKYFNNYINTFKVYKEDRKLRPAWDNEKIQNLVKEVNKYTPGTPEWSEKVAELWVEYEGKVKAIYNIGDETYRLLAQKFKERFDNIEKIYKGVNESVMLSSSQKEELRRWGVYKASKELSLEML